LPREKRSGCLNFQLLPTRTPRCAARAHWDKFAVLGKFTLPTAANSANRKAKTGFHVLVQWLAVTLVLLLIFLHLSRAIEAGLFSRAFRKKLSEPMSFMGEFFLRLENSADSMGTPCAFCRGRLA
jgi:hypothetical protein